MCIVYAVANQKGGCSKTSVTVNLGVGLAMEGKKVLVIDADPQGSLTIHMTGIFFHYAHICRTYDLTAPYQLFYPMCTPS